METVEKNDIETTREEKRENILKELYGHNLAERITILQIREHTPAALNFTGKEQAVVGTIFSFHRLV